MIITDAVYPKLVSKHVNSIFIINVQPPAIGLDVLAPVRFLGYLYNFCNSLQAEIAQLGER